MRSADSISSEGSRLPIVVLISGRGSNMLAIAKRALNGELPVDVRAVISDKADAAGLARASELGMPVATLSPREFASRELYDVALTDLVASYQPELIVLAGFMRILTNHFIDAFAGKIINIHPSLLPKYRGLHTHKRAIEAGDALHGVSVHYVTQELDGGPVIMQACIDVRGDDTEQSLSARVQRQEHTIYSQAIDWIARGRLALSGDRVVLDGKLLDEPVLIDARGT
jgi:phosphoribosylglycinamide formyltransferase 1